MGLRDILNDSYGVYDSIDDIDFDSLPNYFVLKDTLGSSEKMKKISEVLSADFLHLRVDLYYENSSIS